MTKRKKRLVFFEVEPWERKAIPKRIDSLQVMMIGGKPTLAKIRSMRHAHIVSTFVFTKFTKDVLDELPDLEMIATRSTGYDHIDLGECRRRGIIVSNVPTYGENTVAEHTFGLILALSRNIHKAYERTVRGNFTLEGLKGFDLKGKTIGVVGTGNIGAHVIRIAHGFDMRILAHDIKLNTKCVRIYGAKYMPLQQIYAQSDIVTFHVPLIPQTHHLFNMGSLRQLKKGAMIINTSRGGITETQALIRGLKNGTIGAAGLDVLEEEIPLKEEAELLSVSHNADIDYKTMLENHLLARFDHVILTPHSAFFSTEALQRILDTTIDNINAFCSGKPQNVVT